ncbi:MAG: hypothetical protein AB7U66_16695, partial [Hyphomicrobiaceae bacterium]
MIDVMELAAAPVVVVAAVLESTTSGAIFAFDGSASRYHLDRPHLFLSCRVRFTISIAALRATISTDRTRCLERRVRFTISIAALRATISTDRTRCLERRVRFTISIAALRATISTDRTLATRRKHMQDTDAPPPPRRIHPGSGRRKAAPFPKGRHLDEADRGRVRALIGDRPRQRDLLIEYLHLIQDSEGCLPAGLLQALAEEMRLSMAE